MGPEIKNTEINPAILAITTNLKIKETRTSNHKLAIINIPIISKDLMMAIKEIERNVSNSSQKI